MVVVRACITYLTGLPMDDTLFGELPFIMDVCIRRDCLQEYL